MKVSYRSYELDTANIIEGYYIEEQGYYMNNDKPDYDKPTTRHYIQDENCIKHEIAPEYLSINFEGMLDSEGAKIFASLSEDGKGGDLINADYITGKHNYTLFLKDAGLYMRVKEFISDFNYNFFSFKVIGIKKWPH